jgi:hypothetical protein
VLVAFDLIERDGEDLRDLPLIERKRRLARLISKTKNRRAIRYGEHLKGNGASVLDYVCRLVAGRHRLKAGGRAVPKRAVQDVDQVEKPGHGASAPLPAAAVSRIAKGLGYVHMVFDDDIDGGGHASYRASPSVDSTRQEHAGRDIPYGDRKN